jgi:uncharacterized heparinase superfamily protein
MYPLESPSGSPADLVSPSAFEVEEVPARAEELVEGRFEFVGREVEYPDEIVWNQPPEDDLLWLFELHYFGWATDLAKAWQATGEERYARYALQAMGDWIEENPFPEGPGWHPYPTSRRLRHWCVALAALKGAPGWEEVAPRVLASISQQADYLADWPERELTGNHLLANYHALAWVSLQVGGELGERVAAKVEPLVDEFWEELDRQVRADGCHEENSTSYHLLALKDAFELLVLSDAAGRRVPATHRRRVRQMFAFLASLLRPVGRAPLLNDSVRGYPMRARPLVAAGAAYFEDGGLKGAAQLSGPCDRAYLRWVLGDGGVADFDALEASEPAFRDRANRESGYFVMRDDWTSESDWLLFDCGPVGPDHQPGHAHADTLQILLAIDGTPVLVDPGVYTYDAGEWRDYFRSTGAHNTIEVDGEDSSEVWSAFRVARRARAQLEGWSSGESVAGSHDGYRRMSDGVVHRREIERRGEGGWEIRDELRGESGEKHEYCLNFQLSREVEEVEVGEKAGRVGVEFGGELEVIFDFYGDGLEIGVEDSWISETWRVKEPAKRLVVQGVATGQVTEISTVIRSRG